MVMVTVFCWRADAFIMCHVTGRSVSQRHEMCVDCIRNAHRAFVSELSECNCGACKTPHRDVVHPSIGIIAVALWPRRNVHAKHSHRKVTCVT